jgi:hypothetical protein
LPQALLEHDPELPERLSGFALALQDGNAIAGASDEAIKAFRPMLAASLVYLVEAASSSLPARARKVRKPAPAAAIRT